MSKSIIFFATILLSITCCAQINQVLYDFDEIPQTLFLNPGSNYSHDYYIGVPLLSGLSFNGGMTNLTAYDIFSDDGRNINDKIRDVIYNLENEDSFILNERMEVLSAGLRLKNDDFLSFGFYQEFDFTFYYPSEAVQFFYEGSTILDKEYSIDGLNFKTELIGVLHAGISRKINEEFTFGGRLKLYSSVFNAQSRNNKGTFYTTEGTDNFYRHHILNADALVQTTGIIYDDYDDLDRKFFTKKFTSFENAGIGLDLGFTYQPNEQLKITGSALDIGYIKNSKDVFTYYARGNYETEGIEIEFDEENPQDYWQDLGDDFENKLPVDTLYTKYFSYRPIKLNASVKYSFGKPYYEDCYTSNADDPYRNAMGIQLFSIKRPIEAHYAATLFYERRFGDFLRTKVTYTLDTYSSKNIGFGLSSKIGKFNLYLAADNLLNFQNLAKANSTSFQLGMNFIIDKKFP
ncbi:DUF5723 family protein [Urechidicola croceus]|uniref:DUF5723 domain-containing protein n=1 Tax=Urechidicola croceus TaxID=1850246 RepID=A0A1D8PB52_9FLAO|nr:DUF5723 family protein [Urechidicola croceus]AOW21781.1 hypothetical protein LPB138_14320 [Urechidicola croceus]